MYHPYDTEPNVTPVHGLFTGASALFDQGLVYEEDEEWTDAMNTYYSIITTYPESQEASGSVIRLYACTKITAGDFQGLQSYYDLLVSSAGDSDLSKTAEQYSILCDMALEEFAVTVGKYEAILQDPPSLADSVYAVIDIGQVYLASSVASGNGSGKKAALGTMPQYQPADFVDYEEKVNDALGALMGRKSSTRNADVPLAFVLHANYPNPFNPNTTLKYALPENSHVELTVYDLSGRVVTELINKNITAGTHHTIWDGKTSNGSQVSSGVYIYKLTAKSNQTKQVFTQSNKMVLMK